MDYRVYVKHYGVLGMHWGVRKDDRRQSSTFRRLSSHNKKWKGLTPKQKQRLKAAAMVVGLGVGLGVGFYFSRRYLLMHGTRVLKPGTEFQHLAKVLEQDFNKPVYVSYLKSDNLKYQKTYGKFYSIPYLKTLENGKPIKIAGKKDVLEAFSQWVKTNEKTNSTGQTFPKDMDKNALKVAYKKFNILMVSPDIRDQALRDDFFTYLEKKGFSAIHDLNDQMGDFKPKAPLILFSRNSEIMTKSVKEISPDGLSETSRKLYDFYKSL